jgi:hypothetical protein
MKLGQKFQGIVFFFRFYETISNQYIAIISELSKSIYNFTSFDGTTTCRGILTVLLYDHSSGIWWPHSNNNLPKHRHRLEDAYRGSRGNNWEVVPAGFLGFYLLNFIRRAKDWPAFDYNKLWTQFLFVFVAFFYGGLHCLAWNSVFPSYVADIL